MEDQTSERSQSRSKPGQDSHETHGSESKEKLMSGPITPLSEQSDGNSSQGSLTSETIGVLDTFRSTIRTWPPEPFQYSDLNQEQQTVWQKLNNRDSLVSYSAAEERGTYYRFAPEVKDWVRDNIEPNVETAPCGRTGITCISSGETYSCTADESVCDCRFGPERARRIVDHG